VSITSTSSPSGRFAEGVSLVSDVYFLFTGVGTLSVLRGSEGVRVDVLREEEAWRGEEEEEEDVLREEEEVWREEEEEEDLRGEEELKEEDLRRVSLEGDRLENIGIYIVKSSLFGGLL